MYTLLFTISLKSIDKCKLRLIEVIRRFPSLFSTQETTECTKTYLELMQKHFASTNM